MKTIIEKETVTKEVNGVKMSKTTYRLMTVGKNTRSIIMSRKELIQLRNQLGKMKLQND